MTDRDMVIRGLETCSHADEVGCDQCPYYGTQGERGCQSTMQMDAIALLDVMHRAWQTVKFAAIETAQNNAGDNEDVYKILMFMARLMDEQEKRWNDA